MQDFQREKLDFERNMAKFRWVMWTLSPDNKDFAIRCLCLIPTNVHSEEHPDLIESKKKSDIPEKPKTPQQLWYNHEKKIYLKIKPDVSARASPHPHPACLPSL